MPHRLQAWWGRLSPSNRSSLSCAALLFLAALIVRPVWTALDPRTAVGAALNHDRWYWQPDAFVDPWDRDFAQELGPPSPSGGRPFLRCYSTGPNGLDENGLGDDVEFAEVFPDRSVAHVLFIWSRELLVVFGLLLIGSRFGMALATAPRSESLARELARALALSLPAVALSLGLMLVAAKLFDWPEILLEFAMGLVWSLSPFATPPLVSLAGTLFFASYLLALWIRLRALAGGEEPAPARSAGGFGRADAAALGLVLLLLVQVPFVRSTWRAVSPRMRAVQSFKDMCAQPVETWEGARDPWGSRWCDDGMIDGYTWSAGPNRVNESQAGDDIQVSYGICRRPAAELVYLDSPLLLIAGSVAILIAWQLVRRVVIPRVLARRSSGDQCPL